MISDFLVLEEEENSKYLGEYKCYLPDPIFDNEDRMIQCGHIFFNKNSNSGTYTLFIELFDNFHSLCVGDVYKRQHLVETVETLILMDSGFDLASANADLFLSDFLGNYSGTFDGLNEGL